MLKVNFYDRCYKIWNKRFANVLSVEEVTKILEDND